VNISIFYIYWIFK